MLRQYYAPRFRPGRGNPGPVMAGDYLTLEYPPLGKICVDGWLPREYSPCVKNRPPVVYIRGGHLAVVTRLADQTKHLVAEQWLYRSYDNIMAAAAAAW